MRSWVVTLHLLVRIVTALQLLSHGSEAFSSAHRCIRPRQSSSWSLNVGSSKYCNHSQRPPININEEALHSQSTIISCRSLLNRRDAVFKTTEILFTSGIVMLISPSSSSSSSSSVASPLDKVYLRGTVTLQPGQPLPSSMESAALYITVRPNVPDDAPRAILNGSRGKSPPVLSARFPIASLDKETKGREFFPFEFELTQQNLTPEGALILPTSTTEENESNGGTMLWWEKNDKDLIVSARLDTDGVASTRDPEDLIGRGISTHYLSDRANAMDAIVATASIELRGRGLFGKSVTARK